MSQKLNTLISLSGLGVQLLILNPWHSVISNDIKNLKIDLKNEIKNIKNVNVKNDQNLVEI